MSTILKAIEMIRETQTASLGAQIECANFIDTLTDEECVETLKLADSENLATPRNLSFNYKTQKWRV